MKLSEAYPSKFLKADDLVGRTVNVIISAVALEDVGKPGESNRKLVISFSGKEKKLVCNKTNAAVIGKLYGQDTDTWIGKPITLLAREVEFQGDTVWAVRVSLQAPTLAGGNQAAPTPAPKPAPAPATQAPDEDVPF